MDKVLLSICIPTFNGGSTIEETLNCIINAVDKFDDIEVIVSDNCSDDNTEEILKGFQGHKQLKTNNVNACMLCTCYGSRQRIKN